MAASGPCPPPAEGGQRAACPPVSAPERSHVNTAAQLLRAATSPSLVTVCKCISHFPTSSRKAPGSHPQSWTPAPESWSTVRPASRRGDVGPQEACSQRPPRPGTGPLCHPRAAAATAPGFGGLWLSGESRCHLRPVESTGVWHRRPQGLLPAPGPGHRVPAWSDDAGEGLPTPIRAAAGTRGRLQTHQSGRRAEQGRHSSAPSQGLLAGEPLKWQPPPAPPPSAVTKPL